MCGSNNNTTLLVLFLVLEIVQLALAGSLVKYLPGFEGPLPFHLETGYIGVGEGDEVQLFYYFVESQSNPKVDPLLLWISGGPGCSSLDGIVNELGPLRMDDNPPDGSLPTLSLNPYGFTKVANIIFLDLPVGTGFSYPTTHKANYSNNLQAGDHAYQFIRKWLLEHEEYLNHSFYVIGDSYSGITNPIVTQVISDGIDMGIKPWINLKGYTLGNPVTFLPGEDYYRIPYAHAHGLIPDELYKQLVKNCEGEYLHNGPANPLCSRDMRSYDRLLTGIFRHHILEPSCDPPLYDSRRALSEKLRGYDTHIPGGKCRNEYLKLVAIWANYESVQEALHVRKGTIDDDKWVRCKTDNSNYTLVVMPSFTINVNNTISYHAHLSRKGLRSLIYSGDQDLEVPYIATEAWINSLNYSIVSEWRPWNIDGQIAGYTRTYSNQMTFATLKGAGHNAPQFKPMESLIMMKRWLSNEPL